MFSFCTQNDSLFHFNKISDHPPYALYFSLVPFLEPKQKLTHRFAHPPTPTPTRVFMNTPLSRGEYRLLLLERAEPSNPPSRGNLLIFEEKQAANASSLYF